MNQDTNKKPTNKTSAEGAEKHPAGQNPGSAATERSSRLSGCARRRLKKERQREREATGGSKQPTAKPTLKETGPEAKKRQRSDASTPRPAKKSKTALSYQEAAAGIKMVFVDDNLERSLSEEESGRIKTWILNGIDGLEPGTVAPRFYDCHHRMGALHITCSDQATVDWLSGLLSREAPWEGASLRFIEAKNLPTPVRALVWVPGPKVEPATILKRLETQNPDLKTTQWRVVDQKEDPKGQQLVVLMEKTSWDTMGKACQHRPYLNFSRVTFKQLAKKGTTEEKEGENTAMETEGPQEEPQAPSTSGTT